MPGSKPVRMMDCSSLRGFASGTATSLENAWASEGAVKVGDKDSCATNIVIDAMLGGTVTAIAPSGGPRGTAIAALGLGDGAEARAALVRVGR